MAEFRVRQIGTNGLYWLKGTCPQPILKVFIRPVERETEDDEVPMPTEQAAETFPAFRPSVGFRFAVPPGSEPLPSSPAWTS